MNGGKPQVLAGNHARSPALAITQTLWTMTVVSYGWAGFDPVVYFSALGWMFSHDTFLAYEEARD